MQAITSLLTGGTLLMALAAAGGAEPEQWDKPSERLRLYNECRPMLLRVEGQFKDDQLSLLDRGQLSDSFRSLVETMETKLRAFLTDVDLYTDSPEESGALLHVRVLDVAGGTLVMIDYYKPVTDDFGNRSYAATWREAFFDSDDSDPSLLAERFDKLTAMFVAQYTWLTAGSATGCGSSPKRVKLCQDWEADRHDGTNASSLASRSRTRFLFLRMPLQVSSAFSIEARSVTSAYRRRLPAPGHPQPCGRTVRSFWLRACSMQVA